MFSWDGGSDQCVVNLVLLSFCREQEEMYWDIVARKEATDQRAVTNQTLLEHPNLFADDEVRLSLLTNLSTPLLRHT